MKLHLIGYKRRTSPQMWHARAEPTHVAGEGFIYMFQILKVLVHSWHREIATRGRAMLSALVFFFLCAATAHGATITALSCSQTDVQNAVNSASSGDVVVVQGTCTANWGSFVTVASTQGITIEASGSVTLSNHGFSVSQNGSAATRITGFTLTSAGNGNGSPYALSMNGSSSSFPFRVDHNTFDTGSDIQAVFLEVNGNPPGLIDHNTFKGGGGSEEIHNNGLGPSNSAGWTNDVTPGSINMVFVEDNTFDNYDTTYICSGVQSYYGARTVVRHNALKFCQVDQHGTSGMIWTRWWEIYDNTFYSKGLSQCCYIELRGGTGVVWGNTHADTNQVTADIGLQVEASNCSGTYPTAGYPATYQVGRGINQNLNPAYFWNNGTDMPVQVEQGGGCLAQSTDYYVSSGQPNSLKRWQLASDTSSTTYSYVPFVYPYPLDANGLPNPTVTRPAPGANLKAISN